MSTFGYEIEAHISDKELLARYLIDFSDSKIHKFGVDGAGISAIEIRSEVFSNLGNLEISLARSLNKIRGYSPDFKSFCIHKLKSQIGFLTHSVHLSLGSDNEINIHKLYLCFFILYPAWLLCKSPMAFARYMLRKIMYPEMYRSYPERLETRFLSSEFPLSSLWVIKFIS